MLVSLQQHIFGYDDFCAVLSMVFAAPVTFGQLACGLLGFGKDTWAVPTENIYIILKACAADGTVYRSCANEM